MATILLSAAGAAIGGAFGGTAFGLTSAVIGRAVGATLGRAIDQRLLGGGSQVVETGKIERFQLTGASEGSPVGSLYGRLRVGGQVIWSSRFREKTKTSETGGKGGGGGGTTKTKSYSYSVSLAIGLCEGEILGVGRVWADGMEIGRGDLNMRVYPGTETQLPDPKIAAVEGNQNAPAYRGLAYVVFEGLELAQFGNRVPQFSFEVLRATDRTVVPERETSLSRLIKAVALIPGSGEYSLATTRVNYSNGFGWSSPANSHSGSGQSDFSTSLRQLKTELPACESVSLVVSWFGDDLRCGECRIVPKVEQSSQEGDRMAWRVSGTTRDDAGTVPRIDGRPVYGGTPTDQSVVEAIKALRDAGKSVVFYPFILMDQLAGNTLPDPWSGGTGQAHLPWRGRITTDRAPGVSGSTDRSSTASAEVASFFGTADPEDFTRLSGNSVSFIGAPQWSFRRFILHYAHLCDLAGGVDAFCIGTEMRGLTQIRGGGNSFPAVEALAELARDVRSILGPETKIGYAADWSEYFGYHPQDGSGDVFFHLDPLWASDDIDFVGIDNYMPLTDWRDTADHADAAWESIYNLDYLARNVAGGEGFDWYYADDAGRDAQDRLPISDGAYGEPWVFRYKDIRNWWSKPHHERIGGVRQLQPTAWVPQSKPIWFTEIGCAAIDKGTNQPNKFLDPKSSESSLPWYSNGTRDDLIQMQYLRALHEYWGDPANNPTSTRYGGAMVDVSRTHVWAWDARPYPYFPANTTAWSDGANYTWGHWLNGRSTSESLAAVVADVCASSGVMDVDVSRLYGLVRGFAFDNVSGARSVLQPLSLAYGFDASERNGTLTFRTRTGLADRGVDEEQVAVTSGPAISLQRSSTSENVGKVRLSHVLADGDFETSTAEASFPDMDETITSLSELPISLTAAEGRRIAERWLVETRVARDSASFSLPPSCVDWVAGDVVELNHGDMAGRYRLDRVEVGETQKVEAVRVEPELFLPASGLEEMPGVAAPASHGPVFARFFDLPLISGTEDPNAPYIATTATPWPGAVAVYSSVEDDGYSLNCDVESPAIIGVTENALSAAAPGLPDLGAALRVRVSGGELASVTRTGLLNGANGVAIGGGAGGSWEIFQFAKAELVAPDTYELSHRLRGQLGTDALMPDVWPAGSMVLLLDGAPKQVVLPSSARGLERHYRVGPSSDGYGDDTFIHLVHTATGVGLRPFSPVHLNAQRQGDGSLSVRWIRRTRIDGDSWEGLDVPLGEERELYLLRVLVNGVQRREVQLDRANWLYSSSDQDADGSSGGCTIDVAQISERFGAGLFKRIEIDE